MLKKQSYNIQDGPYLREMLRESKRLNPGVITISLLADLFCVSDKTVETWLYEDKGCPHFGYILLLEGVMSRTKCDMPRSLYRVRNHISTRIKRAVKQLPEGKPKHIGEKRQTMRAHHYIFNDESLSLVEISEKTGVSYQTAISRIRSNGIAIGDDVTSVFGPADRQKEDVIGSDKALKYQ